MKETRLIITEKKVKQLTNVVNGLIQKLQHAEWILWLKEL